MFVYTAKLSRRKAVVALLLIAAVLCAVIVIASGAKREKDVPTLAGVVGSNEERVTFLSELGWNVSEQPIDEQTVVIPKEFSEVYESYNDIQTAQGFDLHKYGGAEATRYTYEVLNYPEADGKVYADLVVYRGRVIAGDIQSAALGGFMHGLTIPN